ncbi:hypothetical protein SJDPG2_08610 [Porphyromonas gingivalis SJD2]|nr:hypothetical protein SJDPG2_08610 [Porphyromonas gingivalis SJD2]
MAAVVLRSYETVEQPVVAVGKLFLESVGLPDKPCTELLPHLFDLCIGLLDGIQLLDKGFLLGRRRNVMQNFMLFRTVDPDVLRRAEIADFRIKSFYEK